MHKSNEKLINSSMINTTVPKQKIHVSFYSCTFAFQKINICCDKHCHLKEFIYSCVDDF